MAARDQDDIRRARFHIGNNVGRKNHDPFAREFGKPLRDIHPSAITDLVAYHWPGNIRELRNVIERAVMLCSADRLSHQDLISLLPAVPAVADSASSSSIDAALLHLRYSEAKQKVLEEFTVRYVEGKLAVHGGNVTHAAQDSGIPRQHFQQIMKRYLKEDG